LGRNILAVIAGIIVWIAFVMICGLAFRYWPAYEAAAPQMQFDLAMKIARLGLSSTGLVIAALTVWWIRPSRAVELAFGIVLVLAFIPEHYRIWSKFPIWYHATFFASLILIPLLVSAVAPRGAQRAAALA